MCIFDDSSPHMYNGTKSYMNSATPIYRNQQAGGFRKNTGPVPSHPPPQGYICYRCGEKGRNLEHSCKGATNSNA